MKGGNLYGTLLCISFLFSLLRIFEEFSKFAELSENVLFVTESGIFDLNVSF